MPGDAAPIDVERGLFLGLAAAPGQDQSPFGLVEVFGAEFGDGQGRTLAGAMFCRIVPSRDAPQVNLGAGAGLVDGQHTIAADSQTPGAAVLVAVLNEKGLRPAWLDPQAKAGQVVIP